MRNVGDPGLVCGGLAVGHLLLVIPFSILYIKLYCSFILRTIRNLFNNHILLLLVYFRILNSSQTKQMLNFHSVKSGL